MKRLCAIVLATLASAQVLAVGSLADVTVTDRDTGETLSVYRHHGDYWVAGRPGARYAINIRNQQGTRLMAVTSVDGVNVITGETAGYGQSGYVFDCWAGYDITGWRKSNQQIAAFTFTSVPRSYAARTGRPENIGVIGVALFRERTYPPIAMAAQGSAAAPARDEVSAADTAGRLSRERKAESQAANQKDAAPSLGTGHGQRETSVVVNVNFEREQPEPNEVIRIRYDSQENLVAMGVIWPTPAPRRPQPFPGEQLGYVPDP